MVDKELEQQRTIFEQRKEELIKKIQARMKIKIKQKECRGPLECGIRCIKACPYNLLAYKQKQIPKAGEEPKEFKIIVAFPILCNNCERCVEICPDHAITITPPKT